MEAQEQPTPKRRRVSPLWVLPLLVAVALGIDNGLVLLRDASAKAHSSALTADGAAVRPACGGDTGGCGGGGCGMAGAPTTGADEGGCPAHKAIAAKGESKDAKPGAKPVGEAGGCPMGNHGAAKPASAAGGGCPMSQHEPSAKPAAGGGCPMMQPDTVAKPHQASAGKCPAGASCGKEPGSACPHGGDESCPVAKPAAKSTAKPAASAKAAAVYVCTMCPDVKSDKPGKCPNCGMALVKKGQ